ncbi:MAG: cyclic pyranopterin monophosphate synthase MoaC [Bacteroidales bacterium]|nr:cyclic pyranopterin monophosphate synthase MoaC [Bacteroidales bacterium]
MKKFSHTDKEGKAKMVDVGYKKMQVRTAEAIGTISMSEQTIKLIEENNMKKGDVLTVSEIAGIQGGKRTSDLIPLCHPLQITKIGVKAEIEENSIVVRSFAKCIGQTGIEMEALTAVNIALLTVYDMCKAVDKNMQIEGIRLVSKEKQDLEEPL